MPASAKTAQPGKPASFEAAIARLEELIAQMETGELALEASLAHCREGMLLLQYCEKQLVAAEKQLAVLEADGRFVPLKTPQ